MAKKRPNVITKIFNRFVKTQPKLGPELTKKQARLKLRKFYDRALGPSIINPTVIKTKKGWKVSRLSFTKRGKEIEALQLRGLKTFGLTTREATKDILSKPIQLKAPPIGKLRSITIPRPVIKIGKTYITL